MSHGEQDHICHSLVFAQYLQNAEHAVVACIDDLLLHNRLSPNSVLHNSEHLLLCSQILKSTGTALLQTLVCGLATHLCFSYFSFF